MLIPIFSSQHNLLNQLQVASLVVFLEEAASLEAVDSLKEVSNGTTIGMT
jgi:hypothetical protein